jgi:hypothetical protein
VLLEITRFFFIHTRFKMKDANRASLQSVQQKEYQNQNIQSNFQH